MNINRFRAVHATRHSALDYQSDSAVGVRALVATSILSPEVGAMRSGDDLVADLAS